MIFKHLDLKPLVFGNLFEMSYNVKDFVETAVEYVVEHLGVSIAAHTADVVRVIPRGKYKAKLSLVAWRG